MSPVARISRRWRIARLAAGLGLAAFFLVLGALAWAAGADEDEGLSNPYVGDQAAIAEGEKTFRGRCVGCHWTPMRGPNLFTTKLDNQKFVETVINGRKGSRGQMPPFGYILSPDDIEKVYAFVKSHDRL